MSAASGHHFAGPSNRFWKLLYDSRLVPERVTHEQDVRLPEWGLGMTNLVARPSPGIDDLKPQEYIDGWRVLEDKIARYRPAIVAFVGVTMYRALWKVLGQVPGPRKPAGGGGPAITPGFQHATVHGARIFVLPNPSGRNANFTYDEMLAAFRALRRAKDRLERVSAANEPRERSEPAKRRASTRVGEAGGRSPWDPNARRQGPPSTAAASSAGRAEPGRRKSGRAAGTATRTPASPPVAGPSRKAPRRRAGWPS